MPLGDIGAYLQWKKRQHPDLDARLAVAEFILETVDRSWAGPSAPISALCDIPYYEVREAILELPAGTTASVVYRHTYATDMIDLIAISS